MKTIFKTNFSFLIPYLIFIVLGSFLMIINTKTNIHIGFNKFHSSFFDSFFYYLTYLGDGFAVVLTVIILLVIKYKYAIIVGLSNLIAAIITQTLKQTIFAEVVRPKKFFEGIHNLYFVPGVENHLLNSFPSGHATSAFALFFSLSLIFRNKTLGFILFFVALFVGYSRIYLSQHFFEDVYVGSIIGMFTTIIVYYFLENGNKNWMDKSLVTSFKNI